MSKKENIVLILGAGFSAPAKLPIQDQILHEMTKEPAKDFLSYSPEEESMKFLRSYITVGIFLLQNYSSQDCASLEDSYNDIIIKGKYAERFDSYVYPSLDIQNDLLHLQETIRELLRKANIQICLEDVFTFFDKTYNDRLYFNKYSSQDVDEIKESITRLFVYYFSKCCNKHTYDKDEYTIFFDFIKKNSANTTIISTNWDILTENYLVMKKIKYDLALTDSYYVTTKKETRGRLNQVKLIKVHGSINWFRCLKCGTINIVDGSKCGGFLFNDDSLEICNSCKERRETDFLLQSQIITPTMMKYLNNQLYTNLWASAQKSLRNADHIFFVGYSLPIADYDFRYLLHQSIPNHAKIDVILHDSDNPIHAESDKLKNLLPEKRYTDLFAKNDINFCYDGFGVFFKGK